MLLKKCPTCGNLCNKKNGRCYRCRPGGRGRQYQSGNGTPEPPATGRKRRTTIHWRPEEKERLIETAMTIREQSGLLNVARLLRRAQEAILPPDRQRPLQTVHHGQYAWFFAPLLAAPPLRARRPLIEPASIPEPEPQPQIAPEPEVPVYDESPPPHSIDIETLCDEISTGDLVAVLAKRLYTDVAEAMATIRQVVFDLDRRQRQDRALLRRLVADLDPSYLDPRRKPTVETMPAPESANGVGR